MARRSGITIRDLCEAVRAGFDAPGRYAVDDGGDAPILYVYPSGAWEQLEPGERCMTADTHIAGWEALR